MIENDDVDGAEEWERDEELYDGDPEEEHFFDGMTEAEYAVAHAPAKRMRFGLQLAPNVGDCKIFDRHTWEAIRSWRKHLFKPKKGGGLKCRRCGHDPDDIPF